MSTIVNVESKASTLFVPEPVFRVVPKPKHWDLCSGAETVLMTAIRHNALMPIYDGDMVVKFRRKMAALCLSNRRCGDFALKRGFWYCAANSQLITDLQANFESGVDVFNPDFAEWAEMRPVRDLEEYTEDPQFPWKPYTWKVILSENGVLARVAEAALILKDIPLAQRCKGLSWKDYKTEGKFWEFPYEADLS